MSGRPIKKRRKKMDQIDQMMRDMNPIEDMSMNFMKPMDKKDNSNIYSNLGNIGKMMMQNNFKTILIFYKGNFIQNVDIYENEEYFSIAAKVKSIFVDDFSLRRFGCDLSFEFLFDYGGFRYTISPMTLFGDGITPKVYFHAITYSYKIGILR